MKNVFITGGARGIGRALAVHFAKRGYRVGISYCKSEGEAEELSSLYGITVLKADLSVEKSAVELAEKIHAIFGSVDILVNNAGVSSYGLFQNVTDEEYDRVFTTNMKSVYFLTKSLVGDMLKNNDGVIINITSIWGQTGASCEVLYSSSKAALIGFTKALAKELAPSGIRVNCIAPGVVDTDMMNRFTTEEKNALREEIPVGHFTESSEIAEIALLLCSEKCRSLTGQVIAANGGMYC